MKTSVKQKIARVSSLGSRHGRLYAKIVILRKQIRSPNVSCSDEPGSKKTGSPTTLSFRPHSTSSQSGTTAHRTWDLQLRAGAGRLGLVKVARSIRGQFTVVNHNGDHRDEEAEDELLERSLAWDSGKGVVHEVRDMGKQRRRACS